MKFWKENKTSDATKNMNVDVDSVTVNVPNDTIYVPYDSMGTLSKLTPHEWMINQYPDESALIKEYGIGYKVLERQLILIDLDYDSTITNYDKSTYRALMVLEFLRKCKYKKDKEEYIKEWEERYNDKFVFDEEKK